ncbi:Uncharacterised protein [Mycobacterium tuberculosis]|nr:Uncharacterised protein [Mycobacterium tuberculosis]
MAPAASTPSALTRLSCPSTTGWRLSTPTPLPSKMLGPQRGGSPSMAARSVLTSAASPSPEIPPAAPSPR